MHILRGHYSANNNQYKEYEQGEYSGKNTREKNPKTFMKSDKNV